MAVQHEEDDLGIKEEGKPSLIVFDHGFVRLLRLLSNSGVVAVLVERLEVLFCRLDITLSRDTSSEDAA